MQSDFDSTMAPPAPSLVRLFHWLTLLNVKISLCERKISFFSVKPLFATSYLLSHVFSRWHLVERELLPSFPFNVIRLWWGPHLYFCSPWRKGLIQSVFLHREGSAKLWWSSWPFFGPSPVCTHLELWGSVFQGYSSFFFPFIFFYWNRDVLDYFSLFLSFQRDNSDF